MKKSYYNFTVYDNEYGYWYNSLTGHYFRLSEALSRKLETCMDTPSCIKDIMPSLYEKMSDGGFIIDGGVNELDIIRKKHHEAVHAKNYFLIVLPTLNCNFKCWYCIQDHIPSIMSDSTLESIKNHIDYMIREKGIESLHLDWFGGEPFMFYEQVIKPISLHAIKRCAEHNIPFINGATTNGYFLSPDITSELCGLNFTQFQITLDGEKSFHDKVKYMNGCPSAFDHVLANINGLLSKCDKARVFLRINYTHDTLTDRIVGEVNRVIEPGNRNRVIITPKKVWQENVDKDFSSVIINILDLFSESGYLVSRMDISNNFIPCYVNTEYYNAINFNGNVVKCTACNDLYDKKPRGVLQSDGRIIWEDGFDKKCMAPTFENPECLGCKRLPACMGPCPRNYLAGGAGCKYESIDHDFEKTLLDYMIKEY